MNNELAKARGLYKTGNQDTRSVLEEVFGKEAFVRDWREIKCYQDACEELGIKVLDINYLSLQGLPQWLALITVKAMKAMIIARAINGDWMPDYSNSNQNKWLPWYMPTDRGLMYGGFNCGSRGTSVGARLVFETSEKAEHAGKLQEFTDYFNDGLQL